MNVIGQVKWVGKKNSHRPTTVATKSHRQRAPGDWVGHHLPTLSSPQRNSPRYEERREVAKEFIENTLRICINI